MTRVDFTEIFKRWKEWSSTAVRAEEGWETDFPQWESLMNGAGEEMVEARRPPQTIAMIAECWAASEETEDLLEFARENLDQCWNALLQLAESTLPKCRWQIYEVLADAGRRAEDVLRRALTDPDPYARRRAILALARLRPRDAQQIAESLLKDDDPYIRQAAIEMIAVSEDASFRQRSLNALATDPVDHVRLKARERISMS